MIDTKTATYTTITDDGVEMQISFDFRNDLTASEKVSFVNFVVGILVDETNKTYNGIIKDLIFDFAIIGHFTNVNMSDVYAEIQESKDNVSVIEKYIESNDIVRIVTANIPVELLESLRIAIDENIQYKTGVNPNNVFSSISNLLNKFSKKIDGIDVNELVEFAKGINGLGDALNVESLTETTLRLHDNKTAKTPKTTGTGKRQRKNG